MRVGWGEERWESFWLSAFLFWLAELLWLLPVSSGDWNPDVGLAFKIFLTVAYCLFAYVYPLAAVAVLWISENGRWKGFMLRLTSAVLMMNGGLLFLAGSVGLYLGHPLSDHHVYMLAFPIALLCLIGMPTQQNKVVTKTPQPVTV